MASPPDKRTPSLYRFQLTGKAKWRISKATRGAACVSGTWLLIDGKRVKDSYRATPAELVHAQVELGYGRLDGSLGEGKRLVLPFVEVVPFLSTTAELHEAWGRVADQVERAERGERAEGE